MEKQGSLDCVVLGAGLVGAVIAHHLSLQGLKVAVIEAQDLSAKKEREGEADGRTTAISFGSSQILREAGLWCILEPYVSPIKTIKVFEAGTAFSLNFNHKELSGRDEPMGYMIDNAILRQVFHEKVLENEGIILKKACTVQKFSPRPYAIELTLSDDTVLKTKLVIACEGRHSPSRTHFGIRSTQKDYGQTAMVGTVLHEKPHHHTAFEVFHPKGPLAFLPLSSENTAIHKSALVWSSKENLRSMSEEDLREKIYGIFPYLGKLSFGSKRMFYPLSYQKTPSLIGERYALVGDAGHVMHPVAGQGVNLGWRDAKVLWDLILLHHSLGLDIGTRSLLQTYNRDRQRDQKPLLYVTHSLINLFGVESATLQMLRSYGLGLVNRIPPLKRFLMKKAMGT